MNKRPNPFGGITEIAKAVTDGQFSPIQVVSDFLERIQQIDPILNSYRDSLQGSLLMCISEDFMKSSDIHVVP